MSNYTVPDYFDLENNQVLITQIKSYPFVSVKGDTFYFKPRSPQSDLGHFKIQAALSDTKNMTKFEFKLEVYNNPPTFENPLRNIAIYLG